MKPNKPANPTPKRRTRRDWKSVFIRAIAKTGNVRLACEAARIDRSHVYHVRKEDTAFADAWDIAEQEAYDLLEASAWQRATKGVEEPVFMKDEEGKITEVARIPHYSDTLLIFLLKAGRPEKYREIIRNEHTSPPGQPVRIIAERELTTAEARRMLALAGGDPLELGGNGEHHNGRDETPETE